MSVLLARIYRTGDDIYIATEAGTYSSVDYRGDIISDPAITEELFNVFYGLSNVQSITLSLANADNGVDDTWDEIAAAEELRGQKVVLTRDDGEHLLTGTITDYTLGLESTITITPREEFFEDKLPYGVVTNDLFPTTALDIGAPIPLNFGYCKNVPCANIQNDTGGDVYDYLVGYGTIESLWIDHANNRGIKRDGVLVDEAEYTFDDGSGAPTNHGYAGYATIRFSAEQVNFNGEYHSITADVKGLELGGASADRNFANVIKAILNNATWGLNQSVDAATFTAAAAALSTANYMCDRSIYEQEEVRDILNDMLLVCHSWLLKGSDGEWEMTVDGTGASVADFGENDGYWDNCEVTFCGVTPANTAIRTGYIHYDNGEKEISLACNTTFGIDTIYEVKCVIEDNTAKKLLSYIYGRSTYADPKITIKCGEDAESVNIGEIVTITAPERDISAVDYRVIRTTRTLLSYILECEAYNSSIFDDQVISAPTAQTGSFSTHALQTIQSGHVGGLNITATTIATDDGLVGLSSEVTGGTDWRIWAGHATPGSAPFRVDETGAMWATNATITGSITATTGAIGGWTITTGYVYSLASGTPTAAPNDGVVLASTNPALIVYEDTAKRVELGYLSAGVYGLKGYDTGGANVLFELSDTQSIIAGWTISQTTLANSTNIILDASNKAISIKDATYGNSGIQLQYNAGTPRFYCGDGANAFFQHDGTKIQWKAANSELDASGNIICTGGTIGGFTLAATTLTATNLLLDAGNQEIKLGTGNDIISLDAADADYRLAIGHATYASAPFSVTKAGALYCVSGTIGSWTIITDYLYSLASGTPSASPSDGLVLDGGSTPTITCYENTEKRLELGYLSAGIYGVVAYDDDGSTKIIEVSDTQKVIGGWIIGATSLNSGSNIVLDASNKAISINDSTFGNSGIQLQYNAGTPRFYCGDGSNDFFQFDGTNFTIGSSKSGTAFTLQAGADIQFTLDDLDPSLIKWGAIHNMGACSSTNRGLAIWPTTADQDNFRIGFDPVANTYSAYVAIEIRAQSQANLEAYYDSTHFGKVDCDAGVADGTVTINCKNGGSAYPFTFNGDDGALRLNRLEIVDYGYALDGFHVGGTSDPGTDNLLVDGTSSFTGNAFPTNDSSVTLGTNSLCWSNIYADAGVTACSDEKWKTILGQEPLGLDFVNKLPIIEYLLNKNGKQRDGIYRGLTGQDLEQALIECGYDPHQFAGLNYGEDKKGQISLGIIYEQLIGPIIKSIQELDNKVDNYIEM